MYNCLGNREDYQYLSKQKKAKQLARYFGSDKHHDMIIHYNIFITPKNLKRNYRFFFFF